MPQCRRMIVECHNVQGIPTDKLNYCLKCVMCLMNEKWKPFNGYERYFRSRSMRMDLWQRQWYATMKLRKAVEPSLQKGINGSHVAIITRCAYISDCDGSGNKTYPVSTKPKRCSMFHVQMHETISNTWMCFIVSIISIAFELDGFVLMIWF